jgi:hypothetical protein
VVGVVFERMRSGCSATSSFARIGSVSAGVAQRVSIWVLRPSVHPSFWSPSRNAAIWACDSESLSAKPISTPISSHRKLLLSKAMVVNVAEKSGQDPDRQG